MPLSCHVCTHKKALDFIAVYSCAVQLDCRRDSTSSPWAMWYLHKIRVSLRRRVNLQQVYDLPRTLSQHLVATPCRVVHCCIRHHVPWGLVSKPVPSMQQCKLMLCTQSPINFLQVPEDCTGGKHCVQGVCPATAASHDGVCHCSTVLGQPTNQLVVLQPSQGGPKPGEPQDSLACLYWRAYARHTSTIHAIY